MWLVSRVKDYDYEGEDRTPLFVTANETYAKDWIEAARIERDSARTLKKPVFHFRFQGMRIQRATNAIYDQKTYDADVAKWEAEMRVILQLDKTLDDSELDSLDMIDYEVEEVELRA